MFAIDGEYLTPCRRTDPELFFSTKQREIELAKTLCRGCRIQLICLEQTLETERDLGQQLHGVHGGLTKVERANTTLTRLA